MSRGLIDLLLGAVVLLVVLGVCTGFIVSAIRDQTRTIVDIAVKQRERAEGKS